MCADTVFCETENNKIGKKKKYVGIYNFFSNAFLPSLKLNK